MSIGLRSLKSWCVLGLAGAISVSAVGCTSSVLGNHDRAKSKKSDRGDESPAQPIAGPDALSGDPAASAEVGGTPTGETASTGATPAGTPQAAPQAALKKDLMKFPARTANDGSVTNPVFKDSVIARMGFSVKGDQRKGKELRSHRINEEGVITGAELLRVTRPAEYSDYEMAMRFQGQEDRANWKSYQEYLQNLADGGIALLALNRIIDQESVKRLMPLSTDEAVVDYVVDSILYENMSVLLENTEAGSGVSGEETHRRGPVCPLSKRKPLKIDCGKLEQIGKNGPSLPSVACDLLGGDVNELVAALGRDALYNWLQETIGRQVMTLKVDWNYRSGSLAGVHDSLTRRGLLDWPETKIEIPALPETLAEFRAIIRKELDARLETERRSSAWRALLMKEFPTLQMSLFTAVSNQELDSYYRLAKDRMKVKDVTAKYTLVEVGGEKAQDFQKRFMGLMDAKGKAVLDGIVAQFPRGTRPSEEQKKEIQEKLAKLSVEAPRDAFAEAKSQFAAEIASGEVVASYRERSELHRGDEALVSDAEQGTPNARLKEFLFTKPFMKPPINKLEVATDDCVIKTAIQHDVIESAPRQIGRENEKVEQLLSQQILSKRQGWYFRELAYRLFRRNPVELVHDTCTDKAWPCASTAARRMAESLFPESYFPRSVPKLNFMPTAEHPMIERVQVPVTALEENGQTLSSTLEREDLLGQVMTISSQSFDAALRIPNQIRQ